jgi:hypothetical protein
MLFSVYYHSQENGEYLRRVVDASCIGQVQHFQDLAGLNGEKGIDVVLLEYENDNPHLDSWIAMTAGRSDCPEIFLFVEEVSPQLIWKALKLGAREFFGRTIPLKDFHDAVKRVRVRSTSRGSPEKIFH